MKRKCHVCLPLMTILSVSIMIISCAHKIQDPAAPQGNGWSTFAQGYHRAMFSQTTSTTTSGNYQITTTTTTQSHGLVNATDNSMLPPERHAKELSLGKNVRDYQFNQELSVAYRHTPQSSESPGGIACQSDMDCPGDEICENNICIMPDVNAQAPVETAATPPVACTNDMDCPGDDICENNICTMMPEANAQEPEKEAATPQPTACTKDMDCPGELICENSVCAAQGEIQ